MEGYGQIWQIMGIEDYRPIGEIFVLQNVTLEGRFVRLEPLAPHHKNGLCEAILDGELWKLFVTRVPHPDDVESKFQEAERLYQSGQGLTFATMERDSGKVIGSTSYLHAEIALGRIEIGATFLAKSLQKTAFNTEAKLLMLGHAFESLNLNRVEFLTDYLNFASREAITKLGARQEGILRRHMIMPGGRVRDSVIFSIVREEWVGIKAHLQARLERLASDL